MNKLVMGCLAAVMVVGAMNVASAALITVGEELNIGTTYEVSASGATYGVYLGYYTGNVGSQNDNMAATVYGALNTEVITFSAKEDVLDVLQSALTVYSSDESGSGFSSSDLVYSGNKVIGGTWTSELGITIYAVKGGNGYTAWYRDDVVAPSTGVFTTYGLKNGDDFRDLSHLVGYAGEQPANVPEPSMLSLLGFGLLGLGFIRRKKS